MLLIKCAAHRDDTAHLNGFMPRRLLKKVLPDRHSLSQRWFMRPFSTALKDPACWSVNRRGVIRGFALGAFICFIPLPVHLILAPIAAIVLRANVPVTLVTTFLVNPLTVLPAFFTAYWVGARILGTKLMPFNFAMNWDWVQMHLVQIWKPFLLGCLVTGLAAAALAYVVLTVVWRWRVAHYYHQRATRPKKTKPPQE